MTGNPFLKTPNSQKSMSQGQARSPISKKSTAKFYKKGKKSKTESEKNT